MNSGQFTEEDKKGIDVPFFDLKSILAATDYFSETKMLGQGGFGPVYKVIYPFWEFIIVDFKTLFLINGRCLWEFFSGFLSRWKRNCYKETLKWFWTRLGGI